MRISKLPNLFLALLACSTAAAQAFDYDDIADGRFRPVQLAGIRPTADGEHYTTIRDGNIFRHRYAVDDAGTALLPAAAEEGAVALDSLDRATGTWCDAGSRRLDIADYAIAPDGGVLVADGAEPIYRHSFTTRYLYYDGRRLREILLGIPSPRDAVFTPDGRNIVFSSRNNLYVYNIERQGTRQITRDGRWNETINGTTDWVYEEEFGFTRAFAVSPDSRRIAYLRFDESRVPLFEMMRYDGALYNRAYDFKYPKAGDANSVVTLHVFDLETGRTTKVDTGADTIAGYKEHGAIVHYEATPETDVPLKPEGFLLLDSGAQYLDGTTDITRTIALGELTEEEKTDYTLILKGHINLAMAVFPEGTRGAQLDVLARMPIWQHHMNFLHGTGHGVGHFLNVHEGPQSIRMNENPVTLRPGMVTSNEPGVYKAGSHGIRTENLMLTVKDREGMFGNYLKFETITLCPICKKGIIKEMLTAEETAWLDNYHQHAYEKLSPSLNEEEREWLKEACSNLTTNH